MRKRRYRWFRLARYRGVLCGVVRSKLLRNWIFGDTTRGFYLFSILFFRSETAWRDLEVRDHEYRHYMQARNWLFVWRYLVAQYRVGYDCNPYERDADEYARRRAVRRRKRRRRA